MTEKRRLPIGAELLSSGGAHFRIWAPAAKKAELVIDPLIEPPTEPSNRMHAPRAIDMSLEDDGYLSCTLPDAQAGMLYFFQLDGGNDLHPDPASRFQPQGPNGPSQLIDPSAFAWADAGWQGIAKTNRVLYEMHVGTFTPQGTYRAAAEELPELAALGITVIEMMPVAEFDGAFGWGYDGVSPFSPYHHYGTPDDLRYFIDRAHAVGIGVILDVVYNHCGASGCHLRAFSSDYFSSRYKCEWGDAINFDGRNSSRVREYFIGNAGYWIDEFHFDGLRLDATQQIFDSSTEHMIAAVTRRVRETAAHRSTFIVAENEPQNTTAVRTPDAGGYGADSVWNDDFHHASAVALRGNTTAYFADYKGTPQEFISAIKHGYLYQGQWYRWQGKQRGAPGFDLGPSSFIHFIQNHDQIANSGLGKRIHQLTHPGLYRAMTALLLLGPATPMLFQGQEFGASSPFLYFADYHGELGACVRKGRTAFLHQFPNLAAPETQDYLSDPGDPDTFMRSKFKPEERSRHREIHALHKDLLTLRREDPVFSAPRSGGVDGAVLSAQAFVLRFFSIDGQHDRLLLINFGCALPLSPVPEPLLAPHAERDWEILWSSEHPRYGGHGTPLLTTTEQWRLPEYAALVLAPAGKRGNADAG